MVEKLALEILPELGIELAESQNFSCCPDPIQIQGANQTFWMAAAARNICVAEEKGMNIMTFCNGCLNTLAIVNHRLKNDKELKSHINKILKDIGKEYKGTIEIKPFLQVLMEDIGWENLKTMVKKPLTGLKVAGHPGCHLLMPDEILKFDDPTDPVIYDNFIEALGATAVDYITKADCCGVSLTLVGEKESTNNCLKKKLLDVNRSGALLLSTACPFCYSQFDTGQLLARRTISELKDIQVPVLYAIELLALAMGKTLEDIEYNKHKIKPALEGIN